MQLRVTCAVGVKSHLVLADVDQGYMDIPNVQGFDEKVSLAFSTRSPHRVSKQSISRDLTRRPFPTCSAMFLQGELDCLSKLPTSAHGWPVIKLLMSTAQTCWVSRETTRHAQ